MTVAGRKFAAQRRQYQHLGEKRRKREWAEEAAGLQCSPSKELSQLSEGTLELSKLGQGAWLGILTDLLLGWHW